MESADPRGAEDAESQGILDESIQEGLRDVLGESGLRMVLSLHPLRTFSGDPAKFHKVMTGIFKESGATVIEREIARRLLEKAGRQRARESRRHRWLPTLAPSRGSRPRVSDRERRVLRSFVTLASLSRGHEPVGIAGGLNTRAGSIERTSLRFAAAFKKGS